MFRIAEIGFIGLTFLVTACIAKVASDSLKITRQLASGQMIYAMRREALTTFVQADAQFEAALHLIRDRLPVDIEDTGTVNNLTANDISRLREIVEPIIAARRTHNAIFRSTITAWPEDVRGKLVQAGRHADQISACYEAAAIRAIDDREREELKANLNRLCRNLGGHYDDFRQQTDEAYREMANQVFEAAGAIITSSD